MGESKVSSKEVLNSLISRYIRKNKAANIIAVMAIVLTSLLFTTLFTVADGFSQIMSEAATMEVGTKAHLMATGMTDDVFNQLKEDPEVRKSGYRKIVADGIEDDRLNGYRVEVAYEDPVYADFVYRLPDEGSFPQKSSEAMVDTATIKRLGIEKKIGASFSVRLVEGNEVVEKRFVLSGWWTPKKLSKVGFIDVSEAFVKNFSYAQQAYQAGTASFAGMVQMGIMLKDSKNLQEDLGKFVYGNGFSLDENDPNYLNCGVNPAYESGKMGKSIPMVLSAAALAVLIFSLGYLIIGNILQIATLNDVRFLGSLKAIGAPLSFLKKVVRKQLEFILLIGTPLGLLLGILAGNTVLHVLINQTIYKDSPASSTFHILVSIFSVIFTILTAFLSSRKAIRMMKKVSPVRAMHASGVENSVKKKRAGQKKIRGIKGFSWRNIHRSPRRRNSIMISLAFSIILINVLAMIFRCFSAKDYAKRQMDVEYQVASENYLMDNYNSADDTLSGRIVQQIKDSKLVSQGGSIYAQPYEEAQFSIKDDSIDQEDLNPDGNVSIDLYGVDDFIISNGAAEEGSVSLEQFHSGNYVLLGDYNGGESQWENGHRFQPGDQVTIIRGVKGDGHYLEKTYTILGYILLNSNTAMSKNYFSGDYNFYLPEKEYRTFAGNANLMSYNFNVRKNCETQMNSLLESLTQDGRTGYASRQQYEKDFQSLKHAVQLIGRLVGGIIGLISLVNFVDISVAMIIARKKEFATLRSIGMTFPQQRKMLIMEGIYYVGIAYIFATMVSLLVGIPIIRMFCIKIVYFTWSFSPVFLISTLPVLILTAVIIPLLMERQLSQVSVTEALRAQ